MSDVCCPDDDEPKPEPPRVAKLRVSLTKVEARKLARIVRWERRSAKTCITLRKPNPGDPA